jgi:hypothetical protein
MPRLLRSHPGYVSLATGVLALAVGINVLVFSIVNALWLRPLPAVVNPERVVTILESRSTVLSLEAPALKVFQGPVAGQVVTTGLNEAFKARITFPDVAAPLETLGVTPSYFGVLGISVRGRDFSEADDRVGAEPVGIISDRLWTQAFARSPSVLGSLVRASPRPLRIIGIAPPRFEGARRGERVELWVPVQVVRDLAPDERQLENSTLTVENALLKTRATAPSPTVNIVIDGRAHLVVDSINLGNTIETVCHWKDGTLVITSTLFGRPVNQTISIEGNQLVVVKSFATSDTKVTLRYTRE